MLTCWGPFPGSVNDAACVKSFGISPLIKQFLKFGSTQFSLLADKGYAISDGILTNFHGSGLCRSKRLYNRRHNYHRTTAEYGINCIQVGFFVPASHCSRLTLYFTAKLVEILE